MKKIFRILKAFFIIVLFPALLYIAYLGWRRRDKTGELITDDKEFNLETFKSLSFPYKRKYCRRFLKYLGEGASREVYRLNKKRVIKLSCFQKDNFKQNERESYFLGKKFNYIVKVYEIGENYEWLISEYAKDVSKDKWLKLAGFSFDEFKGWLYKYYGKWHFKNLFSFKETIQWIFIKLRKNRVINISSEKAKQIEDTPLVKEIISLISRRYPDIGKIDSWGVVEDENGKERLVIRDCGLM